MVPIRKTFSILTVAVCMSSSLFPTSGLVLCFSEDGHAALERVSGGQCEASTCQPFRPPVPVRWNSPTGAAPWQCRQCVDIPVGHEATPVPGKSVIGRKTAHSVADLGVESAGAGLTPAVVAAPTSSLHRLGTSPSDILACRKCVLRT